MLDLGRDPDARRLALARLLRAELESFAVRVPADQPLDPAELPPQARRIIFSSEVDLAPWLAEATPRQLWMEVRSARQAAAAIAAGAHGLVAVGHEAGGLVGSETSFVLLQRLVKRFDRPIWVRGGIGLHTAAAAIAGGAAGVVLDSQLALVRESTLPESVRRAIANMDGSETIVVAGHRLFTRPDLPVAQLTHLTTAAEIAPRLGGIDLTAQYLPAGQDAAFAAPLAARFHTAGGVASAIANSVVEHVALAREHQPLARGAALANSHGTEFPIVQGPMTRVSDGAGFAAAVAEAGALPFLALSLMRGTQVRKLLSETRMLLAGRPWGVGILGFVPPELRDEQLAAIADFAPPFALIAGGRPSQARPLEAQGTQAYLHAPSPGLLDMFLKDGARRFVFEGRECGGHVGPRSSFALWEAQLERLLHVEDAANLHLLFAGGIHDGRSAAMVAAMAAPLAARGAKIGVLMGTAYLFTREAVESGAIAPEFQAQARGCDETALLETSPGHAVRCVDTDFVAVFEREKQRLLDAGYSTKEAWAELEKLNLGRLRIASKGLRRQDGSLVAVDLAEQRRDGMYMIGQIAGLRADVCTATELHAQVSDGSTAHLEHLPVPHVAPAEVPEPPQVDVAIVGMACILPGAADLDAYWTNILRGKNAITEVPRERWNPDVYYDPAAVGANAGAKTPSKWGGFIPATAIDPLAYGIPPRSFASIEPVQLLSLEVARRALEDAGYASRPFARERASVIFGAEAGTDLSGAYGFRAFYPTVCGEMPDSVDSALPRLTEDSFPGVLANVIAGRIANRLDLGGVNYTVDAACASSLAAIDLAAKELASGGSDMVLCGGADVHNSINDYLLFSSVHALSPTGQCHSFDAHADGIVLGEGIACVVLKRLSDARRDGDRVYAVIKGIAGSSDGRSLGLTAPRKEGQMRALERAYRRANISPAEIGLVEAHGTGTVVGDRTELATLTEVFTAAGAEVGGCTLGSVKSQIGHTKCAAGMAALIKTALAIHHGVRPPTNNIEQPNPGWKADVSPFHFHQRARPWPSPRRRAALSALGFGGTNFHAVITEADSEPAPAGLRQWPSELFLVRARSRDDASRVLDALERWADAIDAGSDIRLRDLARTVAEADAPVQVAFVAGSCAELRQALASARRFAGDGKRVFAAAEGAELGKVAFLFPGQGSQRPGMLAELFVAFPALQRLLELDAEVARAMFPAASFSPADESAAKQAITDTRIAQPALGIADLAMARILASVGLTPDMLAGHSYGELAALCAAGAFDEATLIALSRARARCILDAAGDDPGTMAAVAAAPAELERVLAEHDVVIANCNAPAQTVISGATAAVAGAVAALQQVGITARSIPVACAFHSPLVASARESFAAVLGDAAIAAPAAPVYSNVTAAPHVLAPEAIRQGLAAQLAEPVRWVEQIEAMYQAGARVFVEVGPGRVLTGLTAKILGQRPHLAIACDDAAAPLEGLLATLAQLAVLGLPLDPSALFTGRDARVVRLENEPPARPASVWLVDGHTAKPARGEPPAGSYRPITAPVVRHSSLSPGAAGSEGEAMSSTPSVDPREAVVVEFLRTMRETVAAQRDVMLSYLGQSTAVTYAPIAAPSPVTTLHAPVMTPAVDLVQAVPAEVTAVGSSAVATPSRSVTDTLLGIVSDRTGYPLEMLDLDLDLEAELSIDSIKRIEILGALREETGLEPPAGATEDEVVEELAQMKTLRGIIDWLEANQGAEAAEAGKPAGQIADGGPAQLTNGDPAQLINGRPAQITNGAPAQLTNGGPAQITNGPPAASPAQRIVADELPLRRYVLRLREAGPAVVNAAGLEGQRFAVTDDGRGIAQAMAEALREYGAEVDILGPGDRPGLVDGLVHLATLADGADHESIKQLFSLSRDALVGGARWIVAASPLGGRFGIGGTSSGLRLGGVSGLIKTLAREWPEAHVRVVDVDPAAVPDSLARLLCIELLDGGHSVEVGYDGEVRYTVAAEALDARADRDLGLDSNSVVLLTGGARGITARVAVTLAERYRCQLELVGRSPLPKADEDPQLARAESAPALRKALLSNGLRSPAEIEAECRRILGAREIRATLKAIEAAGGTVTYHSCDVRDAEEFAALIDRIYADRGRLDGVIHGAGILEDKLARDKTDASFARVFDTKVNGALVLADKLRRDTRFVAFFGSVSGVFGNRGQADYAAANNALDHIARALNEKIAGRAVAVDWGPWSGTGMVSAELEREYARRGIGLIEPSDGVGRLLDELAQRSSEPQVVFMCAEPAAMGMSVSSKKGRRGSTASHA